MLLLPYAVLALSVVAGSVLLAALTALLLGVGGMLLAVTAGVPPASLGACLLAARVLRLVDISLTVSKTVRCCGG